MHFSRGQAAGLSQNCIQKVSGQVDWLAHHFQFQFHRNTSFMKLQTQQA